LTEDTIANGIAADKFVYNADGTTTG